MEIRQLRHFLAIAELGSYARATERLNISQPGLSRSISALEESIGLPLFDRGARGIQLTQAGRMMLPRARSILNERARALDEAAAFASLRRGQVTVGISNVFNYLVTPAVVAQLRSEDIGVDLHLISGPYEQMCDRLETAEMDFAFLLFGDHRRPALDYLELLSVESAVFAPRGHPLSSAKAIPPGDLAMQDWILSDSPALRRIFGEFFERQGVATPRITVAPSSLGLLLMAMQRAMMLTMLPRGFEKLPFGLRVLDGLPLPVPPMATGGLVTRRGSTLSPAARRAARLFEDQVAASGAGRSPGYSE